MTFRPSTSGALGLLGVFLIEGRNLSLTKHTFDGSSIVTLRFWPDNRFALVTSSLIAKRRPAVTGSRRVLSMALTGQGGICAVVKPGTKARAVATAKRRDTFILVAVGGGGGLAKFTRRRVTRLN